MSHFTAIAAALATLIACSQSAGRGAGQAPARNEAPPPGGGLLARLSAPPVAPIGDAGPDDLEVDLPDEDAGAVSSLPYADYEFAEVAPYQPMPRRFGDRYGEGSPTEVGTIIGKTSPPSPTSKDCPATSGSIAFLSGVERGRSLFTQSPGVHDPRRHQIGGLLEIDRCGPLPRVQVVMPMGAMVELVNRTDGEVELVARSATTRAAGEFGAPVLGGSREAFRASLVGPGARTYRRLDEAGLYEISAGGDTAWIALAPHPYYVAVAADGSFRIDGVPAGSYTIVLWSPRDGKQPRVIRRKLTVRSGMPTRVSL